METRAAVAHKAGQPLSIETVELDGPREGEVLVESANTAKVQIAAKSQVAPEHLPEVQTNQLPTEKRPLMPEEEGFPSVHEAELQMVKTKETKRVSIARGDVV